MMLRLYQQDAVDSALSFRNGILVLPTGSGKSHVISGIVSDCDGRVVVLQPSKEILESNYEKILAAGIDDAKIYSASMGVKEVGRVTYATIGTIIKNMDEFRNLDALIIDEAHGVSAKGGQYEEFIKGTNPCRLIGMTATPYRLHTTSYGSDLRILSRTRPKLFDDIIHVTQTQGLAREGFLHPPEFTVSGKDEKGILRPNSTGADYSDESILRFLEYIDATGKIVSTTEEAVELFKHILIFTPTVLTSNIVVDRLLGVGISASTISAKTPAKERAARLADFKSGKIQVMVNVGVLTTGYDFPALDCIISARPTMSLALYYQIIGRCVRPHPDKERVVVFDLVDNYSRFGNPMDMFLVETAPGMWTVLSEQGRLTGRYIGEVPEIWETMKFGTHKGKRLIDVPADYLEWYCGANKKSPDWHKFKAELIRRELF